MTAISESLALLTLGMASAIGFYLVVTVRKFLVADFAARETGLMALVSFMAGLLLEAYLVADIVTEIFSGILMILLSLYLSWKSLKRSAHRHNSYWGGK